MDLVFIGVQQNGLAMPTRVVDRVAARPQGRGRVHYVADTGRFDHSQGYAFVGHAKLELWRCPNGSKPGRQI